MPFVGKVNPLLLRGGSTYAGRPGVRGTAGYCGTRRPCSRARRKGDIMRGRALLVVGLAVGYVLGARAGRERYEQIRSGAQRIWGDPRVQRQVKQAEDFAKEKAPEVVDFV